MRKNRGIWTNIKYGMLILAFFVIALSAFPYLEVLTQIQEEEDPTSNVVTLIKDTYGEYGLPEGRELSREILYEDDEIVLFDDRILEKFNYSETYVDNTATILSQLFGIIPEGVELSVIPVPSMAMFDIGSPESEANFHTFIQLLNERASSYAKIYDMTEVLDPYEDEYLFFRMENCWTARGAFYAAEELCRNWGITPLGFNAYYERMFNIFAGSLDETYEHNPETDDIISDIPEDPIYFYILPGAVNSELVYKDGIATRRPTIAQSYRSMQTFIGSGFDYAVVDGDVMNEATEEETVMVLGDSSGDILATILSSYFRDVLVINVEEYYDLIDNMSSFFSEHNIKHIVLCQRVSRMGDPSHSRSFSTWLN